MPNPSTPYPEFCCPLCHGHRCEQVIVRRPNRPDYETSFYACVLCSAMFLNPRKFTEQPKQRATRVKQEPGPS